MNIYVVNDTDLEAAKYKLEKVTRNWFTRLWFWRLIKALREAIAAYEEREAKRKREEAALKEREEMANKKRNQMHVVTKNGVRTNREEGDFDVEDAEVVEEIFEEMVEDAATDLGNSDDGIDHEWIDQANATLDEFEKEQVEEQEKEVIEGKGGEFGGAGAASTWTDGREGLQEGESKLEKLEGALEEALEADTVEEKLDIMKEATAKPVKEQAEKIMESIEAVEEKVREASPGDTVGFDITKLDNNKGTHKEIEDAFEVFEEYDGTANVNDEGVVIPKTTPTYTASDSYASNSSSYSSGGSSSCDSDSGSSSDSSDD